ncbi:MAG: dihydrodipicolinate synthase family protein [Acidobacteria bacterium]|nr:dihydrodipicolinate synthase family protein [Acidobacteriota bacterium]
MNRIPAGVSVAAITPRRESGHEIDLAAALDVIDHVAASGVAGIAVLGTTGEFPHFDHEERTRFTAFAVKRTKLPVFASVAHSTLDGALELASAAAGAGAAALLLMPPYFFRYSQADIERFFLDFAGEAPSGVPILLYNIPFFTTPIEPGTACRLLATGQFAGIKDSSGDWDYFTRLAQQRAQTPFTHLVGNDVVFTRERQAGAHGVVSGVACAVPELMLGLDRAIQAGDAPRIARLEARLQEFIARLDGLPAPIGVREAMRLRGVKIGPHAVPLGPESGRLRDEFAGWFKDWLVQVKSEC